MRAGQGRDVLLVDADDQGTSADFTSLRNQIVKEGASYTIVRLLGSEVITECKKLLPKYDDIIIDAGGRDTDSHRAALAIADVALIPVQPRSFDIWTLSKVSKMIAEIRTVNPSLKAYTFLNMADPRGTDNSDAAEYAKEIAGVKYLDLPVVLRKAFPKAAAQGMAVVELKPQDPKAIEEISALYARAFQEEMIQMPVNV
jgi:chromosome partitioning protein